MLAPVLPFPTLLFVAATSPANAPERIPDIVSVFPAEGSSVAANGRVVFFGGRADALFVLIRGDGTVRELREERFPDGGGVSALVLDLRDVGTLDDDDLEVGETIRIEDRCDTCTFSGTWTIDEPDVEPPTFDDGPLLITVSPQRSFPIAGDVNSYRVQAVFAGARDDRGGVMGAWALDEEDGIRLVSTSAVDDGQPIELSMVVSGGAARTVCFDARAIDASGNETAFAGDVCADLDPDDASGGCAQAGGSSAPILAPLLALLSLLPAALRRRRRDAPRATPERACRAPTDRAPS
jgi:hypothetical protein